ncbi:MAG: thioredoxin domain-containing protein, partial [Chloroflexi bacterium SZAS-1]|nr:thioredoxin domain-containing protein [Chloroflexi bacterium SZAS-1]
RIAEETLDYLVREMRHPDGGFYSTQDADSEGEEGKFFVWTPAELREVLHGDALVFAQVYDVTERGNFEGKNILRLLRPPAEVARVTGMSVERIESALAQGKRLLFAARERRIKPGRDEKVLTAWNGMALRAFAQAARAFGRNDYRMVAEQNADFLLRELRDADGNLLRAWKDGRAGSVPAFLDDHALLADGLLALYEATFAPRWLIEARALADVMLARFWDDTISGFYDTAADHEALVVRPRDTGDNATPSGNSAAADVLLQLAAIFDLPEYRARAEAILGSLAPFLARYPTGFGRYLAAAEFALGTPHEIALVGDPAAPDMQALCAVIFQPFRPNKVVVQRGSAAAAFTSPLLEGRTQLDGRATAYVCQHYACRLPVTDPAALAAQLA